MLETLNLNVGRWTGAAAAVLALVVLVKVHGVVRRRGRRAAGLPPGDVGWPLVGEMLRLVAAPVEFWDEKAVKAAGDGAYTTNILMTDTVVVTSPELASFALRAEAMGKATMVEHPIVKAVFGKRNITTLKGMEHARMRKLLAKAFTPEATRAYLPALDKCVVAALTRLAAETADGSSVNSDASFKALALDMFFVSAMGRSADRDFLARATKLFTDMGASLMGVVPLPIPGTVLYRALRARKQLDAELDAILAEFHASMKSPRMSSSVLGMLLDARDDDGNALTREEMYDSLAIALFAGHDTTAATMSALVMRLSDPANALVLKKLREEVAALFPGGLNAPLDFDTLRSAKWLNAVMNESWRFSPPVNFAPRVATHDIALPNTPFRVPAGSMLYTSVWALSRNPFWGPHPYAFDPEEHFTKRDDASVASLAPFFSIFGGSSRACIGEQLARLETLIFLARVAQGWSFEAKAVPRAGFPITFETSEMRVLRFTS